MDGQRDRETGSRWVKGEVQTERAGEGERKCVFGAKQREGGRGGCGVICEVGLWPAGRGAGGERDKKEDEEEREAWGQRKRESRWEIRKTTSTPGASTA